LQQCLLRICRAVSVGSSVIKPEHNGLSGPNGNFYADGMVEHDMQVGELLKQLDDIGISDNTIVIYTTDNGPHFNEWPDGGITLFRGEKNTTLRAGRYRLGQLQPLVESARPCDWAGSKGALQFLKTYEEFPPRQKPAAFNLDEVMREMEQRGGGK